MLKKLSKIDVWHFNLCYKTFDIIDEEVMHCEKCLEKNLH